MSVELRCQRSRTVSRISLSPFVSSTCTLTVVSFLILGMGGLTIPREATGQTITGGGDGSFIAFGVEKRVVTNKTPSLRRYFDSVAPYLPARTNVPLQLVTGLPMSTPISLKIPEFGLLRSHSAPIPYADLPTGGGTWANGGNLTVTGGSVIVGTDPGGTDLVRSASGRFTLLGVNGSVGANESFVVANQASRGSLGGQYFVTRFFQAENLKPHRYLVSPSKN